MVRPLVSSLIVMLMLAVGVPSACAQSKPVKKKTVQLKDAQGNDVGAAYDRVEGNWRGGSSTSGTCLPEFTPSTFIRERSAIRPTSNRHGRSGPHPDLGRRTAGGHRPDLRSSPASSICPIGCPSGDIVYRGKNTTFYFPLDDLHPAESSDFAAEVKFSVN